MATPTLIDIDALLEPIPGDNAAGSSVPFEINSDLDDARKEVDPNDYPPDDPMRPAQFKKADWPRIIRWTDEHLRSRSKDLKLAARMTEALACQHGPKGEGFAGLRDGLCLMRRLVEDCWDRLLPAIEEAGDIERRAAPFEWLSSTDRGILFPGAVRRLPLLHGKSAFLTWND
jgi:type VI secretion system protein ImpA